MRETLLKLQLKIVLLFIFRKSICETGSSHLFRADFESWEQRKRGNREKERETENQKRIETNMIADIPDVGTAISSIIFCYSSL